jgi:hypothetical protein
MTNKDEQYYRTTFGVSQLMKDADFKEKTTAWYNYKGELNNSLPANHNHFEDSYSAPLIDIALVWCKEQGIELQTIMNFEGKSDEKYFMFRLLVERIEIDNPTWYLPKDVSQRDYDLAFITNACNYLIKLKNQ